MNGYLVKFHVYSIYIECIGVSLLQILESSYAYTQGFKTDLAYKVTEISFQEYLSIQINLCKYFHTLEYRFGTIAKRSPLREELDHNLLLFR